MKAEFQGMAPKPLPSGRGAVTADLVLLALLPGPSNILLAVHAARHGLKSAMNAVAIVPLAYVASTAGLAVMLGPSAVMLAYPRAVLVTLTCGFALVTALALPFTRPSGRLVPFCAELSLTTLLSPVCLLLAFGMVPGSLSSDLHAMSGGLAPMMVLSAATAILWVLAGAVWGRAVGRSRWVVEVPASAVLVLFSAWALAMLA